MSRLIVRARKDQPGPPDIPKEERRGNVEWLQSVLRRFGPMTEKPQNTTILDFEKPLVELDNRIREVLCMREESGIMKSDSVWGKAHLQSSLQFGIAFPKA